MDLATPPDKELIFEALPDITASAVDTFGNVGNATNPFEPITGITGEDRRGDPFAPAPPLRRRTPVDYGQKCRPRGQTNMLLGQHPACSTRVGLDDLAATAAAERPGAAALSRAARVRVSGVTQT